MCGGSSIFSSIAETVSSIFKPPSAPKIEMPEIAVTPSASALSNLSSVGTGGKVQLGKQDTLKSQRASGGGSGSRGGSALGGIGGGGLKV